MKRKTFQCPICHNFIRIARSYKLNEVQVRHYKCEHCDLMIRTITKDGETKLLDSWKPRRTNLKEVLS